MTDSPATAKIRRTIRFDTYRSEFMAAVRRFEAGIKLRRAFAVDEIEKASRLFMPLSSTTLDLSVIVK